MPLRPAASFHPSSSIASARGAAAPYSRRPTSQPKSSRQQFSACGACRMRRVRCDLKDLPMTAGPHPVCSNCKERGIKCVDEFADVKAVKLLRRGRRLQQVEAIYGKADSDGGSPSTGIPSSSRSQVPIPNLHVDMFSSPFWRRFLFQRPILDSVEFPRRFLAHVQGSQPLRNEGFLITMLLVIWAASLGLNERGVSELGRFDPVNHQTTSQSKSREMAVNSGASSKQVTAEKRMQRKERTDAMVREVLELIDNYGVLRRPTLDGVRVLLLIFPLMEERPPLEKIAVYEAALSQVQILCMPSSDLSSQEDEFDASTVRARIYWYAHAQEGIMTGLKGGRFVLNNEDLDNFDRSLTPTIFDRGVESGASLPPSPGMGPGPSTRSFTRNQNQHAGPANSSFVSFSRQSKSIAIPLHISAICRKIHSVLTGISAARRAEEHGLIDAQGMRDVWRDLDRCWSEIESLRLPEANDIPQRRYNDQFIAGWQIHIFECHNIIRESLKQYVSATPTQGTYAHSPPHSATQSNSSPYLRPSYLYTISVNKCLNLLPIIIRTIELQVAGDKVNDTSLFKWDMGLVRDGCFFAAYLAANASGDILDFPPESKYWSQGSSSLPATLNVLDAVAICQTALTEMEWAFSKTEDRQETIKMVLRDRKLTRGQMFDFDADFRHAENIPQMQPEIISGAQSTMSMPIEYSQPQIGSFHTSRRPSSAPGVALAPETQTWPTYTPPGTAETDAGITPSESSPFQGMSSFKGNVKYSYYHGNTELEQFSYNAPMDNTLARDVSAISISSGPSYSTRSIQPVREDTSSQYMGAPDMYTSPASTSTAGHSVMDFRNAPHFNDNNPTGYH